MSRLISVWLKVIGVICGLFVIGLLIMTAIHFVVPSNAYKDRAPLLASAIDNVFGTPKREYPRGQPLDAIQNWVNVCYGPVKASGRTDVPPVTRLIYTNIEGLVSRMEADQSSASAVVDQIQGNQVLFSVITIGLSLAVTLINAALANNLIIDEGRSKVVKYGSIAIPATLTAVASLNAIFVNTEASARKNQVTAAIVDLATTVGSDLVAAGCVLPFNQVYVGERLTEWSRRYSTILVSSISGNADIKASPARSQVQEANLSTE